MTISELIDALSKAKRQNGDIDVVWINNAQYADLSSLTVHRNRADADKAGTGWVFSGPVAVIGLDKS